jgi:tetratricopeptide (TPR) repeat protein
MTKAIWREPWNTPGARWRSTRRSTAPIIPTSPGDANNIGQILQAQGDLAGALEYTRRALAIDEKVYGPDPSRRGHPRQQHRP